jgi:hypothetical protein
MKFIAQKLIVIALMPVCLAGCFDRDREMINRKSDGTDTFKFKVPPPRVESGSKSESKQDPERPKSTDADDIETFKFDRDAKYLPKRKPDTGR